MDINDDSIIPGSVYLVDVLEHTKLAHSRSDSNVILSPSPSNDVNDPLNWSKTRKLTHIICIFIYTSAIGIGTAAVYSILQPISNDTGISLSTLNAGTGYMFLLLGWGALINQPLALTFGKRGIYLISVIGNTLMCIWSPYITTDSQWLASKILQGFFCTPVESLCEVSIADIFFAHERGTYIGLYTLFLFGSNFVAPIIAGFIYVGQGWHWVMYWCAIINAVSFVIIFFFMEETNYVRSSTEASEEYDREKAVVTADDEKKVPAADIAVVPVEPSPDSSVLGLSKADGRRLVGTPKAFVQRLAFFDTKYASVNTLLTMAYRPLLLLRFPVVFWAGFQYGSCLVWYNVLNATASLMLSGPPYNFSASSVGMTYFAPLVGIIISGLYSGWVGDRFALHLARRSGGIREPEHRLWLMIVSIFLCPASLILWGVGASKDISWVGLVVGMGMSTCSTGIGSSVSLAYALDSYKDLSGEVMMTVIIVRNTLSFAIGYGITPWLDMGLQNTFITAAFVGLAITMTFLPVIYWGKRWRKDSRHVYWRFVATNSSIGH